IIVESRAGETNRAKPRINRGETLKSWRGSSYTWAGGKASRTSPLEQPQEPEGGSDTRIPRQGDRAGAGAGTPATPAHKGRQQARRRRKGHDGAAIVGG